jgi:hypothetical protein
VPKVTLKREAADSSETIDLQSTSIHILEDSNLLSSIILQMKLLDISNFTFFGMFMFLLVTTVKMFYNYQGRYCRPAGIYALFYGTVP